MRMSLSLQCCDEVAEWLWRWTATISMLSCDPLGSARVGSNPILVVQVSIFYLFRDDRQFFGNTSQLSDVSTCVCVWEGESGLGWRGSIDTDWRGDAFELLLP